LRLWAAGFGLWAGKRGFGAETIKRGIRSAERGINHEWTRINTSLLEARFCHGGTEAQRKNWVKCLSKLGVSVAKIATQWQIAEFGVRNFKKLATEAQRKGGSESADCADWRRFFGANVLSEKIGVICG